MKRVTCLSQVPDGALYATRDGRVIHRVETLHGVVFTRAIGLLSLSTGYTTFYRPEDVDRDGAGGILLADIDLGDLYESLQEGQRRQILALEGMIREVYSDEWDSNAHPVRVGWGLIERIQRIVDGKGTEQDAAYVRLWLAHTVHATPVKPRDGGEI